MDNFYVTAKRMWQDSNILKNHSGSNSWFNTCYLSGYILECYGKLLIAAGSAGNPRSFGHRIGDINTTIQTTITINPTFSKYCLDLQSICNNVYQGQHIWNPLKRYEDDPNLWNSQDIADKFINETKHLIDKIDEMKIDGVI